MTMPSAHSCCRCTCNVIVSPGKRPSGPTCTRGRWIVFPCRVHEGAGVSDLQMDFVERSLGVELPSALRTLYSSHNGQLARLSMPWSGPARTPPAQGSATPAPAAVHPGEAGGRRGPG